MDFVEPVVGMLNALSTGAGDGVSNLLLSPQEYSPTLYNAAVLIHNTAVKPVTAIVLAIMAVLMLASNSTKIEGDRELGVRIIAGTMFKIAMVLIAVQNAVLILDAIAGVATTITVEADAIDIGNGATGSGELLGDAMRTDIKDGGTGTQLGLMVVLLLPFVVAQLGTVIATVMVFIRFLQMYLMSVFASLPIAFFAHEETKQIAIGYLKRFGVAALTGAVLVITVKLYQALLTGWLGANTNYDGDIWAFVIGGFGSFFVAPLVLVFLIFGANGIAKAIVGEG